ncbi:MAG: GDSL-type esterase/lipase family protein [Candidatus Flexifilum sp.]
MKGHAVLPILFGYLILGAALIAGAAQRRWPRLRPVSGGLLITYVTVGLIVGGAEVFFRCCYAESDGLPTRALDNWLDRYWVENRDGYRDRDWTADDLAARRVVLAVGDSFTAGWGIPDPAARFTGVLQARLGEGYAVVNLGDPGATTPKATANLTAWLAAHPTSAPAVVIWQYYLNDIDDAALSIGLDPGLNPLAGMPAWAVESYLGNFLYWRFAGAAQRGTQTYIEWLFSMYDNSTVWAIHEAQIEAAIDAVESTGAALIAVIFPDMLRPFDSIPYVDRVAEVFARRGYGDRILRLFDQAEAMPVTERIVSFRDAHPSAAFHALVGDLIAERFFADDGAGS